MEKRACSGKHEYDNSQSKKAKNAFEKMHDKKEEAWMKAVTQVVTHMDFVNEIITKLFEKLGQVRAQSIVEGDILEKLVEIIEKLIALLLLNTTSNEHKTWIIAILASIAADRIPNASQIDNLDYMNVQITNPFCMPILTPEGKPIFEVKKVIYENVAPSLFLEVKVDCPFKFVLASRGIRTNYPQEWRDILSIIQVDATDMTKRADVKCHISFYKAFCYLNRGDRIKNALASVNEPVLFTGHSLGGAVVKMLAIANFERTGQKQSLITFGAPRGGNKAYEDLSALATDHTRIQNSNDPVPRLPAERKEKTFAEHSASRHVGLNHDSEAILGAKDEDMEDPVKDTNRFIDDFHLEAYAIALIAEMTNKKVN